MAQGHAFFWSDALRLYRFGDGHPLDPLRLEATMDLLRELALVEEAQAPRPAPLDALLAVHREEYVAAVRQASQEGRLPPAGPLYGLGCADNPVFPGMHEAALLVCGASLDAAEAVLGGRALHAVNLGGGLHHALAARAAGFCVYNDPAVAIARFRREGLRVAYVDVDAHHGDGVQWIFYGDPGVLTVSFHESGRFLFPGTGEPEELGAGEARGTSVNIPLLPGTGDDSWLECLERALPPLFTAFGPDVLVSQHGCDAHLWDPLTHLALSTRGLAGAARLLHRLAHEHCGGRWVVLGGGGYDLLRVVPRAWTLLWAEVCEADLPPQLPPAWRERWQPRCRHPLPGTFLDGQEVPQAGTSPAVSRANRDVLRRALKTALESLEVRGAAAF